MMIAAANRLAISSLRSRYHATSKRILSSAGMLIAVAHDEVGRMRRGDLDEAHRIELVGFSLDAAIGLAHELLHPVVAQHDGAIGIGTRDLDAVRGRAHAPRPTRDEACGLLHAVDPEREDVGHR